MRAKAYLFIIAAIVSCTSSYAQIHRSADSSKRYTLNPVVVTGAGHHQRLKKSVTPVRVLSAVQIQEQGITNLQDALLRMLPQIQMTPSSLGNFLRLNGLGNKYALVLVNGRRVIGDMSNNVDLDKIEISQVRRIEVIDGASSSLYGSDAIGGVINIITDQSSTDGVSAQSRTFVSGKGRFNQSVSLKLGAGGFLSNTTYSYNRANSFSNNKYEEVTKDGETTLQKTIAPLFSGYRTNNFSQKLSYTSGKTFTINGGFDYYEKITHRPRTQEGVSGGTDYEMRYRGSKFSAGAIVKIDSLNSIHANFDADHYHYGREYQVDGKDYKKGDYTRSKNQEAYSCNLQAITHFYQKGTSVLGLDLRRDHLKSTSGNIDNGANTFAAYLQHETPVIQNINLTAGVRFTRHQNFGNNFSPKISLMYSPSDFNFRLTYSRGFRTPGLDELYYNYFNIYRGKPQISIGSPDLKPEKSDYYSINAEYHKPFLSVSVSGYFNFLGDMIIKKNIPVDDAKRTELKLLFPQMTDEQAAKLEKYALYTNSDKGRVRGVNVSASAFITTHIDIGANYAYCQSKTKSEDVWTPVERSVKHTVTLSSSYHNTWGLYSLNVTLSSRIQSKTLYLGYENAPGYGMWNLNTTHTFTISNKISIEPQIGVENIFNRKDTRPDASLRKYALFSPGRMVTAGLRIIFN